MAESKQKTVEALDLFAMIADDSDFSTDSEEEEELVKIVFNLIAMLCQSLCFFRQMEITSFAMERLCKSKDS